jgi:hypothetical protein
MVEIGVMQVLGIRPNGGEILCYDPRGYVM